VGKRTSRLQIRAEWIGGDLTPALTGLGQICALSFR
jgi:hypothetical protein